MRIFVFLIGISWILQINPSLGLGLRFDDNVSPSDYPPDLQITTQPLLDLGFIDVTKPPYNADPTGMVDSRAAIQRAADDAYANNLVTFVPKGTYLLSGAIRSIQTQEGESLSQRKFARTLVGDNSGGTAPVLKLMDNSTELPEQVFLYFAYEGANFPSARHYASLLRGFTIDMGNNPTASAVSMRAAQWSTIQDIEIIGNFDAGIVGLPGSGGSTTNVHIKGGQVGIRQDEYRPTPSVHAVTLENQSQSGIELLNSRGALVIVGFDIKGNGPNYQAVSMPNRTNVTRPQKNLVMVDGQIELGGGAQIAISGRDQDIFLRDCYILAPTLIQNGNSGEGILLGDQQNWLHVEEYLMTSTLGGTIAVVEGTVVTDGDGIVRSWGAPPVPVNEPPSFLDKHRWDAANFPTIFNSSFIDVRDYGATASQNTDDDSTAINAALRDSVDTGHPNFGKAVFLPRGHYHVQAPIDIPLNAILIGASSTISVIEASTDWRPTSITALVRTEDGVGPVTIANLAISGHEPSATAGIIEHKRIALFHGRSSNMMLRDVQIARREYWSNGRGHYGQPVVHFSGNAGGHVFNLGLDHWHGGAEKMAAGHRMIKIRGIHHPLRIFQPDVEGTGNNPQVEIRNSKNVYFYAFKYEGDDILLDIINSQNIEILGGSGNYDLQEGAESMINIVNSSDLVIANLARQGAEADYAWVSHGDLSVDGNRHNLALFAPSDLQACSGSEVAAIEAQILREKQRSAYSRDPKPNWIIVRIKKLEDQLRDLGCEAGTSMVQAAVSTGPTESAESNLCATSEVLALETDLVETKNHPAYSRNPQPEWITTKIDNLTHKLFEAGCGGPLISRSEVDSCTIEAAASFEAELAEAKMHPAYSRDPQPDWMVIKIENLEDKLRNLGCVT